MRFHPSPRGSAPATAFVLTVAVALSLLSGGCVSTPTARNQRLHHFEPTRGYRLSNVGPNATNTDSIVVVLTFSGGGTRAAALAYGVLEVLRGTPIAWEGAERTLLDEVDVISSVSGGSLPAAYYGLFGDRIFEDFPEEVLYKNIQGSLIKQLLFPRTNFELFSPFYTRTDIMARRFGREFFGEKTFGDLSAAGRRPFIVINATDIASGTRFEFTQDQFDHLYSDLNSFPIGYAVAASAAFPGAFPPLTLRNYERGADYALPAWEKEILSAEDPDHWTYDYARSLQTYDKAGRRFIHLTDGGLADNLGLLPVIQVLRQSIGSHPGLPAGRFTGVKKVLIVTVNAETSVDRGWDARQSPLGLIATLLAAGTTPLSNFTRAQVEYIRLLLRNYELQGLLDFGGTDANGQKPAGPECRFVEVSFAGIDDPAERDVLDNLPTSFKLEREEVDLLRAAAAKILAGHPDFQGFIAGLQPGVTR